MVRFASHPPLRRGLVACVVTLIAAASAPDAAAIAGDAGEAKGCMQITCSLGDDVNTGSVDDELEVRRDELEAKIAAIRAELKALENERKALKKSRKAIEKQAKPAKNAQDFRTILRKLADDDVEFGGDAQEIEEIIEGADFIESTRAGDDPRVQRKILRGLPGTQVFEVAPDVDVDVRVDGSHGVLVIETDGDRRVLRFDPKNSGALHEQLQKALEGQLHGVDQQAMHEHLQGALEGRLQGIDNEALREHLQHALEGHDGGVWFEQGQEDSGNRTPKIKRKTKTTAPTAPQMHNGRHVIRLAPTPAPGASRSTTGCSCPCCANGGAAAAGVRSFFEPQSGVRVPVAPRPHAVLVDPRISTPRAPVAVQRRRPRTAPTAPASPTSGTCPVCGRGGGTSAAPTSSGPGLHTFSLPGGGGVFQVIIESDDCGSPPAEEADPPAGGVFELFGVNSGRASTSPVQFMLDPASVAKPPKAMRTDPDFY